MPLDPQSSRDPSCALGSDGWRCSPRLSQQRLRWRSCHTTSFDRRPRARPTTAVVWNRSTLVKRLAEATVGGPLKPASRSGFSHHRAGRRRPGGTWSLGTVEPLARSECSWLASPSSTRCPSTTRDRAGRSARGRPGAPGEVTLPRVVEHLTRSPPSTAPERRGGPVRLLLGLRLPPPHANDCSCVSSAMRSCPVAVMCLPVGGQWFCPLAAG